MPMGTLRVYPVEGDMEMGDAVAIARRFKNSNMMLNGLVTFIEQKRKLGTCEDALEMIKEKCRID